MTHNESISGAPRSVWRVPFQPWASPQSQIGSSSDQDVRDPRINPDWPTSPVRADEVTDAGREADYCAQYTDCACFYISIIIEL